MQSVPASRCASVAGPRIAIRASVQFKQYAPLPILRGAFLFVIASAFACQAIAAKPVVYDTGYEIDRKIVRQSMYWIDNERLLFEGRKTSDMNDAIAKRDLPRIKKLSRIYLWEKKTALVRLHAEGSELCVANGIVHYAAGPRSADGRQLMREGPLGSEREYEVDTSAEPKQTDPIFGQLACRTFRRTELAPTPERHRNILVLRDGSHYLDMGPNIGADLSLRRAFPRNLLLYANAGGSPLKLPVTWDENLSPFDVLYSEYRGAYILQPRAPRGSEIELSQPWPKGVPLVAYTLWPDGRLETVAVPYWPSEFLTSALPTKTGWIFGGGDFYRAAGLYLFDGKAVLKLDSGLVKQIAVPSNGCLAAVAIQNRHLQKGRSTNLKIFELCSGTH